MRKLVYLIVIAALLFVIPTLILHVIYGDSYGLLSGEDTWLPDGNGGWSKHGNPSDPMPVEASTSVPTMVRLIPLFLPALFIVLYLVVRVFRSNPKTA